MCSSSEEDEESDEDSGSECEEDGGASDEGDREVTARPTLSVGGGFRWDVGTAGGVVETKASNDSEDEEIEDVEVWHSCDVHLYTM